MTMTKPVPERADLIIDGLDRLTEDHLGMNLSVQIVDSSGKPVEGWRFSIRTAMAEVINGRTDVQGGYKGHRVLFIRQGTQEKLTLVVEDSSAGDWKTIPEERELSPEEIAEIKRRQEEEEHLRREVEERQRRKEAERLQKEEETRQRQEEEERLRREEKERQRREEEIRQREEREREAAARVARREAAERRKFEEERREREVDEARKRMVEFERKQQHRVERPKVLRGILEGRGGRIEAGETVVFPRGEYLIQGTIEVMQGGMLRIEPGVKLNFSPGNIHISCNGLLLAVGTESAPIQFTSRSWRGIDLNEEGAKGSRLQNCEISNAVTGLLINRTTNVELGKLTLRNNSNHGLVCLSSNVRRRNMIGSKLVERDKIS